jgi:hypothetical protein
VGYGLLDAKLMYRVLQQDRQNLCACKASVVARSLDLVRATKRTGDSPTCEGYLTSDLRVSNVDA